MVTKDIQKTNPKTKNKKQKKALGEESTLWPHKFGTRHTAEFHFSHTTAEAKSYPLLATEQTAFYKN